MSFSFFTFSLKSYPLTFFEKKLDPKPKQLIQMLPEQLLLYLLWNKKMSFF